MLKTTSSIIQASQIATPITFAGNVTLSTGNLVVSNSKGIDFSATPGTGTSELLADYEEGTWSPVVQGTSTAGTATYSVQIGQYTKIGNRVLFNLRIIYTGGTGTGNLLVGGLPFLANASMAGAVCNIYNENIAGTTSYIFVASIPGNTSYIGVDQVPTGGGGAIGTAYDAAGDIAIAGQYFV